MVLSHDLRPLEKRDHSLARSIYADAIKSQAGTLYSFSQVEAWSALAWLPGILDESLNEGKGWVALNEGDIAAFALRYPDDRLALLYCRGRFSRKGYATSLVRHIEKEALNEGLGRLVTEASLLSYKLLLKLYWECLKIEHIQIAGIAFKRYKMEKIIRI